MKMLYCGCHRGSGHYLWTEHEQRLLWRDTVDTQPWGASIDGTLYLRAVANGVAKHTQFAGWTALSWPDNSIDGRPGSHSTFVAEGTFTAEEMLTMARSRFPWVFERFKYEVVLP